MACARDYQGGELWKAERDCSPGSSHPAVSLFLGEDFSSVQLLCCVQLCDPMNHSTPGLPAITNYQSPPKPMSIVSVIPSNHLILCRPLLLLPSIFPSIWVFSNQSALRISIGVLCQSIGVSASTSALPMNTQD